MQTELTATPSVKAIGVYLYDNAEELSTKHPFILENIIAAMGEDLFEKALSAYIEHNVLDIPLDNEGFEEDYLQDMEQAREKLTTRYDWSTIPKEFEWASTDSDGMAFASNEEPEVIEGMVRWSSPHGGEFLMVGRYKIEGGDYWKQTKEQRPKDNK